MLSRADLLAVIKVAHREHLSSSSQRSVSIALVAMGVFQAIPALACQHFGGGFVSLPLYLSGHCFSHYRLVSVKQTHCKSKYGSLILFLSLEYSICGLSKVCYAFLDSLSR